MRGRKLIQDYRLTAKRFSPTYIITQSKTVLDFNLSMCFTARMANVFDFLDEKCKDNYLRHLRNEAFMLEEWFRDRGTPPEQIYDILDAFRYIGLCHMTFSLPDTEQEKAKMVVLDMIDDFRGHQSLASFKSMSQTKLAKS